MHAATRRAAWWASLLLVISLSTPALAEPAQIDLNQATASELEALPGIGPAKARAIVETRERNGPFKSIDELSEVKGIGPAALARLRPLVTVRPPGKLAPR